MAKQTIALTGNEAGAYAFMHVNPDAAAAFPITPQTEMMHKVAEFIADGEMDTVLTLVESEHSAMSATVGSAAAGARVFTATSANGFALMWEIVYIAASLRLPIVMALVNRALSGPINIHNDHSDSMGGRDAGWIQLYSENSQEVYDNIIQACRISEDMNVRLPVMATLDGFIISHTTEVVEILDRPTVQKFVGPFKPLYPLLDTDHPVTYGPLDLYDYYHEHKRQQVEAMKNAPDVILNVGKEYGKLTGREYGFFEEYHTEDADVIIVVLGSSAGTAKVACDRMREMGHKVGVLKLRVFRPFPYKELARALSGAKVVGVMDRCMSFGGFGGPVFTEVRSAMFGIQNPPFIYGFVYGLGGRDITDTEIQKFFKKLEEFSSKPPETPWEFYGARE